MDVVAEEVDVVALRVPSTPSWLMVNFVSFFRSHDLIELGLMSPRDPTGIVQHGLHIALIKLESIDQQKAQIGLWQGDVMFSDFSKCCLPSRKRILASSQTCHVSDGT